MPEQRRRQQVFYARAAGEENVVFNLDEKIAELRAKRIRATEKEIEDFWKSEEGREIATRTEADIRRWEQEKPNWLRWARLRELQRTNKVPYK